MEQSAKRIEKWWLSRRGRREGINRGRRDGSCSSSSSNSKSKSKSKDKDKDKA